MTNTDATPPLILVIDDSPVNRTLTKAQLARLGYDVRLAADGLEGLAFLQTALDDAMPRLVLMDWHMPPPDGLETARLIRETEAEAGRSPLPIVALTAQAMIGDREQCLAAGMNDFLARPVRLADLSRVLDQWVRPVAEAALGGRPLIEGSALHMLVEELGDAELVGLLVDTYLDELASRIQLIITTTDPVEQRRVLHTLKSTSAMVGTTRLAELATRLERESVALGASPSRPLVVPASELRDLARRSATELRERMRSLG